MSKVAKKVATSQMALQVAANHPQVAGFGYLVANLATLVPVTTRKIFDAEAGRRADLQ